MNQQPQPVISSYNMLPFFKTNKMLYLFSFIIVLMIIGMFMILYNVKLPSNIPSMDNTNEQITYNVLIIMFILILVIAISIKLLPEGYNLVNFLSQIKWVGFILFYVLGLILFFRLTPNDIINNYASTILIVSAIISVFLFYNAITTNYIYQFNVNYERIKSILLLFFFIVIISLFYSFNPGGYITKYFGPSLIFTFIIVVLALLYVIILLSVPDNVGVGAKNFLSNFTNFSFYSSALFIIFLIVMTIIISTYPGGIAAITKKNTVWAIVLLILIVLIWVIMIGSNLFQDSNTATSDGKIDLFKKGLLYLSGLVISGLIIFWIVYSIENLSGKSSVTSFILNLLIVVIVLALIYRTMNVKIPDNNANLKKNAFFDMIIDSIFYIPCLFSNTVDSALNYSNKVFGSKGPGAEGPGGQTPNYFTREKSSFILLLTVIVLILLYIFGPILYEKLILQGGNLLVNNPVNTNKEYSLGTYEELNGSDNFDYKYAISSWIFINSDAPNTNESYNKYTTLMNFGGKPNILYNGKTNSLMVTMQQKDLNENTNNKLLEFDEEGNRILYIKHNVLLQKWNNIIINYNGGILDIFINGELVKSDIGVVPYYTLDSLTIGKNDGVNGGICNVIYFKKALTALNIYFLYNMIKNKTPPITNDSNLTIMKQNYNTVSSSYQETF